MELLYIEMIFWGSLGATLLLLPPTRKLAFRTGILDRPAHRKIHSHTVPYLGGLALFGGMSFGLGLGIFLFEKNVQMLDPKAWEDMFWVLGLTAFAVFIGLIDDRFTIPARTKLLAQTTGVTLFALFAHRFEAVHLPGLPILPLHYLSVPFTVFWMLALINAFNLIDGVDGLAGSVALMITLFFSTSAFILNNPGLGMIGVAATAGILGFLFLNWTPARIYLGDAGSCGLGTLLVAGLVSLGHHGPEIFNRGDANHLEPFPFQLPLLTLLMAYPALEVSLSVARRMLRGRPIGSADKGHLHHRFRDLGWSNQAICSVAAALSLLTGLAVADSLLNLRGQAAWLLYLTGLLVGMGLPFLGFLNFLRPDQLRYSRPHFRIANHFSSMQMAKLELTQFLNEVLTLTNQTCIEFGVEHYSIVFKDEKGEGEWIYRWRKPSKMHRDLLPALAPQDPVGYRSFTDVYKLPDKRGEVVWTFEAQLVSWEDDIDVEYCVLMADFMRKAMNQALLFCTDFGGATESSGIISNGATVNAKLLKQRTAAKQRSWTPDRAQETLG